uniref:Putative ATPase domain containing protein n=1 Tax=viral metagenome TaxID=1070528 RepID=A0A6M3LF72_9ZZZZ
MEIKLNSLTLENFKGIKSFTFEVNGKNATVRGINGCGKTTLMDGWMWLLFGKDSDGRADFSLKTLDDQGQELHNLDHSVEAKIELTVPNALVPVKMTLKKVFKEKWTKKRGAARAEFTGHETQYFIDGVPLREKEWKYKLSTLIDEDTFKLLTNPTYFNGLHWQKRREILLQVCGDVSDQDVIASDEHLKALPEILGARSLEEHRKVVAAQKKEINDRLKEIPARIDELTRSLTDATLDRGKLESEINLLTSRIEGARADTGLADLRKQLAEAQAFVSEKQAGQAQSEREARRSIDADTDKIQEERRQVSRRISDLESNLAAKDRRVIQNDERMTRLRQEFKREQAKSVPGGAQCPTCGQPLPHEQVDAATARFHEQQATELARINQEGKAVKEETGNLNQEIVKGTTELAGLRKEVEEIDAKLKKADERKATIVIPEDTALKAMQAEVERIQKQIVERPKVDTSEMEASLAQARRQIATMDAAEKSWKRIDELSKEEKALAAKYEDLERQTFLMEKFIVSKVGLLETKINSRFSLVHWKMFDVQINGGISEACEATVNGVPFSSANTGSQIMAGLDIISTLSDYYKVLAPIFLDHRESLTSDPETDSQLISLVADEKFKTLEVTTS